VGQTALLEVGRVVAGRYRIVRPLGAGGMGAVYEAEHTALGRVVALKVLVPALAQDAEAVARFEREARSAAAIGHPGIVEVFDLGVDEGRAFLVMERLEGEELAVRIRREGAQSAAWVARLGRDLSDAVASAHDRGIVHRDLKPQNVFLVNAGRRRDVVKVLDFGIAKLKEADRADAPVTKTGAIYGTPLYMPPEQLRGERDLDGRSDVWAIGAVLHEALAGRPPFLAESLPELVLRITTEPPPDLERGDVPASLRAVVSRALSKRREERFASAHALADALHDVVVEIGAEGSSDAWTRTPAAGPADDAFAATVHSGVASRLAAGAVTAAPTSTRKRRALAGVAAGLIAIVAAGAWFVVTSTEPSANTDRQEPGPVPPAATASPDPPAPATARVRLASEPSGARVTRQGRLVCTTPCEGDFPSFERLALEASVDGHEPLEIVLDSPPPEHVFRFRTLVRPGPTKEARRPAATTAPDLPPLRGR